MKPKRLSDDALAAVAQRFRLLGEPARLRLLQILEAGERSVNELAEACGANQATTSRHLAAMHAAGILQRRREGTSVFYSVADPVVFRLCELVCESTHRHAQSEMLALAAAAGQKGRSGCH
jgi:DNA-binding transcriptional ArsR family regulator